MTTARLSAAIQIGILVGPNGTRLRIDAPPYSAIARKIGPSENGMCWVSE
jgi:hypothetical protein